MKISDILNEQTLNELGTSPSSFSIDYSDDDMMEVNAHSIGLSLTFTRTMSGTGELDKIIIEFSVNGRFDLTGKGNAITILSTVKNMVEQCLPQFMTKADQCVSFGAEKVEASRVSLYHKFVPIVNKVLGPGWVYQHEQGNGSIATYNWYRAGSRLAKYKNAK